MEAKDLMIGDWVNIGGDLPQYSRVTELKRYDIQVCNYWIDAKCITPIPLTDEILKANGFEHIWGTYAWIRDSFYLHCQLHGEAPYSIEIARKPHIPEIMYVHELQHALRLCGLTDLADNFKI